MTLFPCVYNAAQCLRCRQHISMSSKCFSLCVRRVCSWSRFGVPRCNVVVCLTHRFNELQRLAYNFQRSSTCSFTVLARSLRVDQCTCMLPMCCLISPLRLDLPLDAPTRLYRVKTYRYMWLDKPQPNGSRLKRWYSDYIWDPNTRTSLLSGIPL